MKKFLFMSLLSFAVLGFVGCAEKSASADGMKTSKCGTAKKSASKCGSSSKCGSK